MSVNIGAPSLPPNDDRGVVYFRAIIGFVVPSLLIIAIRTLVRTRFTKRWWDDYLMLCVVVSSTLKYFPIQFLSVHIQFLCAVIMCAAVSHSKQWL